MHSSFRFTFHLIGHNEKNICCFKIVITCFYGADPVSEIQRSRPKNGKETLLNK